MRIFQNSAIIAVALCLGLSLIGETYRHTREDYARTVKGIHDDLYNYAQLVGEHTINVLDGTDQLLQFLQYAYTHGDDVGSVLRFMNSDLLPQLGLNQIGVIDERGISIASSLPDHKPVDLSDREHFVVHKEHDDAGLFISKPVVGRASGKLSIQLSRRINKPDGSFGGVVVASLNPYYFSERYDRIRLGTAGTITIVGLDGIIRARRGMEHSSAGQDIAGADLFKYLKGHDSYAYRRPSVVDGIDRFYTYKRLPGYPLVVLVGMGHDEALKQYQENRRLQYWFAGFLSLLTLLFALLVVVLLHKKRLLLDRIMASRRLAEQANQCKTDFLSKVTHEVRTPLHAVTGLTDYLLHTPLSDDQRDCLGTVKESADHLIGMVDDLLDIAKIEAGQLQLEQVHFEIRALLESIRRILSPLARDKGIDCFLDWQSGDAPVVVEGDPRRLRQIILNLAANSIKFTTVGAARIRARCEPLGEGGPVRLAVQVEDSGPGIPEAVREAIFQPFIQADPSIAGQYGGTGLGLAICRQLVELMGGTLTVESTVGVGSVFRFALDLPRGDPRAIPVQTSRDLTLPPLAIMVVDDNPTNIKVAVKLLYRFGQSPEHARNGRDALAALRSKPYDVVLLDIEMGEMDGFEVTRRIRGGEAGPDNREVPIIAMTAHSLRTFQQQCLEAGMQGFVAKPIEVERLYAVLSGLARRRPRSGQGRGPMGRAAGTVREPGSAIDVQAALERLAGDRQLYRGVYTDFLEKYDPAGAHWPGIETNDPGAVGRYVHTLKGVARTLGAEGLAALAERMEQAVRDGNAADALALFPDLEAQLRQTVAILGRVVEGFGPAAAASL